MDNLSADPNPGQSASPPPPQPGKKRGSYKVNAFSQNRNPRIHIRQDIVAELVALGVADNPTAVAYAVGEITKFAIARGTTYLTDLGDITAMEVAVVDRLAKLTTLNAELLRQLSELAAVDEESSHTRTIQTLTRGLGK
jgi:hypothetical protein